MYDDGIGAVAVAYTAPERKTAGTLNALLLAVHRDRHGQGIGAALMAHVEVLLATRGERTRRFYGHIGYEREALIGEYYDAGDDKVVFGKAL